ncbi:MAG: helix-turn-helix transcriptional regulator [Clostridia bacterium]|nr:helix-turn-helix transcriptional regulator [Clostridia bacterium]
MNHEFSKQYKNLGLNIAFYRKMRGYTQMQLAELLDIDRSHMSAIELANVGSSLDVIFRICDILRITPKELFDFREI